MEVIVTALIETTSETYPLRADATVDGVAQTFFGAPPPSGDKGIAASLWFVPETGLMTNEPLTAFLKSAVGVFMSQKDAEARAAELQALMEAGGGRAWTGDSSPH